MDNNLGVAGRLEEAAAADELPTQLIGVGQIPVMANGEPAELEIGEQGLHVAQRDLARRSVADVSDRRIAAQASDHFLGAEIVADMAEPAMRVELLAIIGDDPGSLLPAVLQRVEAECRQCCRIGVAKDPEHAAFFMEVIRVQGIGRQGSRGHRRSSSRHPLHNSFIKEKRVDVTQPCYRVFLISRSISLLSPAL